MHTKCYSYGVAHVPGKEFLAADALSGAPLPSAESLDLVEEVAAFVERITANVPIKPARLEWLRNSRKVDQVWVQLRRFCSKQWHSQQGLHPEVKPYYYQLRHQLRVENDLLLRGTRE